METAFPLKKEKTERRKKTWVNNNILDVKNILNLLKDIAQTNISRSLKKTIRNLRQNTKYYSKIKETCILIIKLIVLIM